MQQLKAALQPDNSGLSLPSPSAPRSPLLSDSCLSEQRQDAGGALLHNELGLLQALPFVVPEDGVGRMLAGTFSSYGNVTEVLIPCMT